MDATRLRTHHLLYYSFYVRQLNSMNKNVGGRIAQEDVDIML